MTYDISMPAGKKVVFPSLCVVCEKPDPDGLIKLSFLGVSTGSLVEVVVDDALKMGGDEKYHGSNSYNKIDGIPACKGCSSSLKWYHWMLKFGYYTAWIPGLALMLILPGPIILRSLIVVSFAMAPGVLTLIFPTSFGASFLESAANFEFRSKKVAEEFLRINSDATEKGKTSEAITQTVETL